MGIGQINGPVVPGDAGAKAHDGTAVGGHHVVAVIFVDHRGFIGDAGAQAPPVQRLVLDAAVEVLAVAPFLVVDRRIVVAHVNVQGIIGGPAGKDRAHFKTQIFQRLV